MIVMEELSNSFEDRVHFNLANWYFHYDKFTLTYIHHENSTFLGGNQSSNPLFGRIHVNHMDYYIRIYIYSLFLFIYLLIDFCYMIYNSSFCYFKCQ